MASLGALVNSSEFIADSELAYKISEKSQLFIYGANDVLFRQGDAPHFLYLLKCGEAVLTMQESGKIVMRLCAGAGSLIGLPAITGNKPYTMTARASGELQAYCLEAHQFEELIEAEPQLSLNILHILAAEVRSARGALTALADAINHQLD